MRKVRKVPPDIFDGVEGVDLAEGGAPRCTLFGFGLVVKPEGPIRDSKLTDE